MLNERGSNMTDTNNCHYWRLPKREILPIVEEPPIVKELREKIEAAIKTQKTLNEAIVKYKNYLKILEETEKERPLNKDEKESKQAIIKGLEKFEDRIKNEHLDELIKQKNAELGRLQELVVQNSFSA